MTFVTFHAGSAVRGAGRSSPVALINLLFRSAARHHPGCRKIVLTDLWTAFPDLDMDIRVIRYDLDPSKTMLSRMAAQILFLSQEDLPGDALFLDSDMLVNGGLSQPNLEFDIALTYRTAEDPHVRTSKLPINGGVLWISGPGKKSALDFLEGAFRTYQAHYESRSAWWGDQYALLDVIGHANIPRGGEKTLEINQTRVLLLPCETYNFSPPPFHGSLFRKMREKKILHFKGRYRKAMMPLYWNLHYTHRKLLRTWSALLTGMLAEKLAGTHPQDTLWRWKQRRQRISKSVSRALTLVLQPFRFSRNDLILRKIIQDKRVLILGSGRSAGDVRRIPHDVKVLTCNAGLKILMDQKLRDRADIFVFIRSKAGKTMLVDGKPVPKTGFIEDLLQKIPAETLVTTHPDAVRENHALRRSYNRLLWDDGRNPRYLLPLIRPHSLAEIARGSPLRWTSAGIRLLQYALFFGAREIYLAGIDFGHNGYAWGPLTNEWRHAGIDENFVQIVAAKYDNIYSLSQWSPATRYVKYKNFHE